LKDILNGSTDKKNIQEYRTCRVPFGVISSPFLLAATFESHQESYQTEIAKELKNDMYADNVKTGTETEIETLSLYMVKRFPRCINESE